MKPTHIVCLSGGEASAKVAIYVAKKFGKENVVLLNHDINPKYEHQDIKRFKKEVADYIGVPITYANYGGVLDPSKLPDQFDVCLEVGALTSQNGDALCTHYLKTKPFFEWLSLNFYPTATLFEAYKECIVYYGFDANEIVRVQRRSGIMGAKGYKTDYPIFRKKDVITSTLEVGIVPPSTYSVYKHANCVGCLKAGLLHWYVTYCLRPEIYNKASVTEQKLGYYIHVVTRDKVSAPISLEELRPIYETIQADGIPATEHQSEIRFGLLLRKYQIEACNVAKPCECTT